MAEFTESGTYEIGRCEAESFMIGGVRRAEKLVQCLSAPIMANVRVGERTVSESKLGRGCTRSIHMVRASKDPTPNCTHNSACLKAPLNQTTILQSDPFERIMIAIEYHASSLRHFV